MQAGSGDDDAIVGWREAEVGPTGMLLDGEWAELHGWRVEWWLL